MALTCKFANLDKITARLKGLGPGTERALRDQLAKEADEMVAAMKRAAPTETKDDPGHELRDSIRHYPVENRAIAYRIIGDARDAEGKFIGSNVEAGHRNVDGSHTPATPFFFPTYRARKKGMQRRLSKAGRDAVRKSFGE
jgi:hypothetical protein